MDHAMYKRVLHWQREHHIGLDKARLRRQDAWPPYFKSQAMRKQYLIQLVVRMIGPACDMAPDEQPPSWNQVRAMLVKRQWNAYRVVCEYFH